MHIPDGILSAPVLAGGAALAAVEAAVTAFVVGFLARVQPGALAPLAVRA